MWTMYLFGARAMPMRSSPSSESRRRAYQCRRRLKLHAEIAGASRSGPAIPQIRLEPLREPDAVRVQPLQRVRPEERAARLPQNLPTE